jgi:hypothetical protein
MSPGSVGFRVYGSEGISNGAMNFDNLEITHLIPEPASIALLALGGIGLLRRRRRNDRSKNMNAKLWTPCLILLSALLLAAGNAQAVLLAYDGFEDGGGSPGPSQYLTGTASNNGSGKSNDSIIGQSPSVTPGFATSGAWNELDPLTDDVYFRAEPGGLGYTSGRNQTLATTAGQVNLFRTPAGTYTKRAERASDDQTLPPSVMYFSGLLNTSTGRTGRIRITWGGHTSISVGLDGSGNAIVSTGSTVHGTSAETFAQNATHLLVGKIIEGGGGGTDDAVTLWVNPYDLRTEGANSPTLNNVDLGGNYYEAGVGNVTLDRAILSGTTGTNSSVLFDELRVSNVWRQVVPFVEDFREEAQFQQQVAPTSAYLAPSVTIRSDQATTNQDDDPDGENIVGRVGSAFMRTLFEFDLTAARRAKTIESAELILTSRGGGEGGPSITMDLHEYGFPFDETVDTWNDPDGDGGDLTGDPTDGGTLGTFLTAATFPNNIGGLEVLFGDTPAFRTAVEDAIASGDTTLRLILKLDDESGSGNFFARFWDEEYSTLRYHPELVLLYTPIPEPSTLALLALGGIGLWRRRKNNGK